MFGEAEAVVTALAKAVEALEPGRLSGHDAARLLEARRLEELPATAEALRRGALSESQAAEVASAASACPGAEADLLAAAGGEGVVALRQRCARLRATSAGDERARHLAVHRSRYLRHWTEADGAFRVELRTTAEGGGRLLAAIEPHRERIFAQARREGRREPAVAYAADALAALADASAGGAEPTGPRAMVHVRVDHAALVRGHTAEGEVCEVPGVGPIPVAAARALAADSILSAVVTDGVDVRSVVHLGRTVTASQRRALAERDPTCVVAGCDVRDRLEIDHVDGWALTRRTTIDRLARLCSWHHHLKTYCGHRLAGGPGSWHLCPPENGGHGEDAGRGPPEA